MGDFGDLFGGVGDVLGEMFGGGDEAAAGFAAFLSPEGGRRRENVEPPAFERYLCGKPRELNINDR
jgi:hypothetical protein